MRFGVIAAVVVAIALALSVCASDKEAITATATDAVQVDTIVDVAVGIGDFTTLAAALTAAGLLATLSGEGPFTVFAATDDATIKLLASLHIQMPIKQFLSKALIKFLKP